MPCSRRLRLGSRAVHRSRLSSCRWSQSRRSCRSKTVGRSRETGNVRVDPYNCLGSSNMWIESCFRVNGSTVIPRPPLIGPILALGSAHVQFCPLPIGKLSIVHLEGSILPETRLSYAPDSSSCKECQRVWWQVRGNLTFRVVE